MTTKLSMTDSKIVKYTSIDNEWIFEFEVASKPDMYNFFPVNHILMKPLNVVELNKAKV